MCIWRTQPYGCGCRPFRRDNCDRPPLDPAAQCPWQHRTETLPELPGICPDCVRNRASSSRTTQGRPNGVNGTFRGFGTLGSYNLPNSVSSRTASTGSSQGGAFVPDPTRAALQNSPASALGGQDNLQPNGTAPHNFNLSRNPTGSTTSGQGSGSVPYTNGHLTDDSNSSGQSGQGSQRGQ